MLRTCAFADISQPVLLISPTLRIWEPRPVTGGSGTSNRASRVDASYQVTFMPNRLSRKDRSAPTSSVLVTSGPRSMLPGLSNRGALSPRNDVALYVRSRRNGGGNLPVLP